MIVYFADRQLNILGQASTELPGGLMIANDLKTEDVETGVAVFECDIPFDKKTRGMAETWAAVGNYILRSHDGKTELYSIMESETDTKKQLVYLYAEDAGMDLLNVVFGAYEADKAYPISHYINMFAAGSGFQIGINEAASLTRKLMWDGEGTGAERIASVATQFDGCEISYSFEIKGLNVTKKFINIFKERGQDVGIELRLNRDIDNIITTKSIMNLATALQCTGATPEDDDYEDDVDPVPITLQGYTYDDGDFYVDGAVLKSRTALKTWSRYLWSSNTGNQVGGHIVRPFSYDTLEQSVLCAHAITKLKQLREMEVNYKVDISKLPPNVRIGDRVSIVDDDGGLYLSSRILVLETSVAENTFKATIGEHLIKSSGVNQKIEDMAAQFSVQAAANAKAIAEAEAAKKATEEAAAAIEETNAELEVVKENVTTNLCIESSRGTVFKNDSISTVLSVVIYRGAERITDITALRKAMGNTAYIQWKWQRLDEETFGVISADDSRMGNNGFTFTLSPDDVNTKVTFMCELIV